jgi:RNA polymerase-binding transcription factor DksA
MDVSGYKDALLRKKGELFGSGGIKPLQASMAIEEALLRIEKGTYGTCRDCGEPIATARLNAIPWTRVCITCKEKQQS